MNAYWRWAKSNAQYLLSKLPKRSVKEPVSQEDLANYLKGDAVWTGVNVDRTAAMGIGAVWACVRVLSETLASLPVHLYRRLEKGKERATEHPIYRLLHVQPNPEQTPFQFKETLMGHLVLAAGNCYAQKIFNKAGEVAQLWPLNPEKMKVTRNDAGMLDYEYTKGSRTYHLTREQVFHIPGLGFDGIQGYSPIEMEKQAFGMNIAAQQFGARFFENNAWPGGYIGFPAGFHLKDDAAVKRLKVSWGDQHKDWGKKHSVGVLEDGAEFNTISIPPNHAQFIETRKFEVTDIARIFRVPPHMIADLERATFSNIEHQGIEFVVHSMRPWLVRWEQAISLQLLSERDRDTYFAEFLVDALLRGDIKARADAYETFRKIGLYSVNDILEMENRNPIEGGDKHHVPMNWVDMNEPSKEPQPVPNFQPDDDDEEEKSIREKRSQRAATTRYRIANSYVPLLTERIGRIVRKEGRDIKAAMKKHLRSQADFELFLEEYYREFPDYIRTTMTPVFRSLAENVKGEVAIEIDVDGALIPEDEAFIRAYATTSAHRHIGKSRANLRKAIARSIDEQVDMQEALTEELAGWPEKRGGSAARDEAVRGSNAFAKNVYLLSGIIKLCWIATGAKTCPYCMQMDGNIVGIDDTFALPGDVFANAPKELNVQHKCGHAPLHRGCDCQIVAA